MDRTGAERQRRYIAKLKAAAARPQAGVADAAEVARLKARIAELEAELAPPAGQESAAEELAEARRIAVALRPLFDEFDE